MWNAALGAFFALVSAGLVLYLLRLVLSAARLPLGGFLERQRLQRCVARAAQGDRQLEAGALAPALAAFQSAFYPYAVSNRALAAAVANHHTGLLTRFIVAADQHHGQRVRLMSLAKADRLFQERGALQTRYLSARESGARQRQRDLGRALHANARELRTTLAALAAEITAVRDAVRYH